MKTVWIPETNPHKGFFKSRFGTHLHGQTQYFEAGKRYVVDDLAAAQLKSLRQREGDPDSKPLFVIMECDAALAEAERKEAEEKLGTPRNPIVLAVAEPGPAVLARPPAPAEPPPAAPPSPAEPPAPKPPQGDDLAPDETTRARRRKRDDQP
jgi:hypothetical protein